MANLVKIKEVYLYVGFTASAGDCYAAKKLLDDNGVKYTLLAYHDESQHQSVFDSLSTWNWGNPSNPDKHKFSDFPILHWKEYYDDFEQHYKHAEGLEAIKNSTLLKNTKLVG